MTKPTVTRTINPLPFGDLEPKRFEDLVRALAYDFRKWRSLEATGRSGTDRGYDTRAFEIVEDSPSVEEVAEGEDLTSSFDRLWLIQCKREKAITPEKAKKHLADINIGSDNIYGMIFAAACDFSLNTRDEIRSWARSNGMAEIHIWGKGELEDQLRQPKNDHLLFAFFGISMQIRKRSIRSELRSLLAVKRKCVRLLKDRENHFVLVRDPTDKRYPNFPETEEELAEGEMRWAVLKFSKITHRGLAFSLKEHFAYLDDNKEDWDILDSDNLSAPFEHDDYWHVEGEGRSRGNNPWPRWNTLSDQNQAFYHMDRIVPFENIIDIDEHGDQLAKFPHIYIDGLNGTKKIEYLSQGSGYSLKHFKCLPEKKVDYFFHQISPNEPLEDAPPNPRFPE